MERKAGALISGATITLANSTAAFYEAVSSHQDDHYRFSGVPIGELNLMTRPSFCTRFNERVYITAIGCEFGFGTHGLQAAGAGGP